MSALAKTAEKLPSVADVVAFRRDKTRVGGFDFDAAHARLRGYRSRLSRLTPEARRAVLTDTGPEVAGLPGSHDK